MNVVKFYRDGGNGIEVARIRIGRAHRSGITVSRVEDKMLGGGWTRRRPAGLRPHAHRAQRPGYHQPSAQQQRRARQEARKSAPRRARFSSDI